MTGMLAPEWPLAAAIAATAWRMRPRPSRPLPGRPLPGRSTATDAAPATRHPALANGSSARSLARTVERLTTRVRPVRPVGAAAAAAWCDGIARSLRSGATLSAAIVGSPRSREVDAAVGAAIFRLQRGATTSQVVDQIERESGSTHLVLVATVLRTLATHGGPAAEPVDRTAAVLRQRAAAEADRATQSAQARLSARVMTVLPVAMLAIVSITSTTVRTALSTPVGAATVALGVFCNLVGWLWMRRIIAGGSR